MKICVVGLGAVGGIFAGWLGSRLAPGEVQVSALARGATLAAVQQEGLRLFPQVGPDGPDGHDAPDEPAEPLRVLLHASDRAEALGVQDLVIVAVKGPALAGVAPALQALCGPRSHVLVAMNGVPWWFFDGLGGVCDGLRLASVDPGGVLAAAVPTARVVGCVVHLSSSAPAPARVRHVSGNGLIIGEPAGGISTRVTALAALLGRAGFAVTVSDRIQREIWFKLWGNMTMNPVSALTSATCDRILDDPLVRGFCSAVMLEAQMIGEHIGIPIDQAPAQRHAITRKLGAFKTSMLQDAEAGRPLEIDALVGAVHEIGRHLGLATPNIDALLGLVRLMAQQRGLYPEGL